MDAETIDRPGTALAVIPKSKLPTLLAADKDDILGKLAEKVAAFRPDISTAKGRAEIRSLAAEIASTKMDLVRMGKGLTEEWRAKTKAVNAECNTLEERMDELKAKVREPLTAWENADKERIEGHERAIAEIVGLAASLTPESTSTQIGMMLEALPALADRSWQEFTERASRVTAETGDRLRAAHARAVQREDEAAELARLRAAEAERQRGAGHEAAIAELVAMAEFSQPPPSARVDQLLIALSEKLVARDWQDFEGRAAVAANATAEKLNAAFKEAEAREEEERRRREEEIRVQAAKRAREEAEAKAAEQAAAAEARAKADREALEKRAAEEAAAAAAREAQAQRDLQEAADRAARAEHNRKVAEAAAQRREREAAEQAKRDQEAAVAAERRRQEQQAAAERAAADKRAADKAHRGKINRAAANALMVAAGLTEETAQAVVAAIARGEIPATSIAY